MRMRELVFVAGAVLCATQAAFAAGPTIGDILSNPNAYNYKQVSLVGTVQSMAIRDPYSPKMGQTCVGEYTFSLDDGSGSLIVGRHATCGSRSEWKAPFQDGDRVRVQGQFAPDLTGKTRIQVWAGSVVKVP